MTPAKKVLIVEDESDLTLVLSMKLKSEGFDVRVAKDAFSAIMAAKEQRPDLILLDFAMPAGSGGDVYRRLGNVLEGVVPPVIFLSAFPLEKIRESVPAAPNVHFMSKPADFPKLMLLIRTLLKLDGGNEAASVG